MALVQCRQHTDCWAFGFEPSEVCERETGDVYYQHLLESSLLYGIGQTHHQRAKAKGEGCTVLLLYAPYAGAQKPYTATDVNSTAQVSPNTASDAPHIDAPAPTITPERWILLVTAGDHPAHRLELLRDVE